MLSSSTSACVDSLDASVRPLAQFESQGLAGNGIASGGRNLYFLYKAWGVMSDLTFIKLDMVVI